MAIKINHRILTPRQREMGYRVVPEWDRLCLYFGNELVAFCSLGSIPGVLREAAWRDAFFRNLERVANE